MVGCLFLKENRKMLVFGVFLGNWEDFLRGFRYSGLGDVCGCLGIDFCRT